MKSILIAATVLFSMHSADGQDDTWKVYHNKKILLSATKENEAQNVRAISSPALSRIGELAVNYMEANPNAEWKRTIAIFDDKDNTLFEKAETSKIQLSNSELRKLARGKKKLKIYTWAIPKDPAKAALVRIRRVHLCTLNLK